MSGSADLSLEKPGLNDPEIDAPRDWADAQPLIAELYIFGTRTRGDFGPASDLDIVTLFGNPTAALAALKGASPGGLAAFSR